MSTIVDTNYRDFKFKIFNFLLHYTGCAIPPYNNEVKVLFLTFNFQLFINYKEKEQMLFLWGAVHFKVSSLHFL